MVATDTPSLVPVVTNAYSIGLFRSLYGLLSLIFMPAHTIHQCCEVTAVHS